MTKFLFGSYILNCALSGLESFVLSDREHMQIQTAMMKIARKSMGKVCTQVSQIDGHDVWQSFSIDEICSRWHLLSHKVEMILRRIQYY